LISLYNAPSDNTQSGSRAFCTFRIPKKGIYPLWVTTHPRQGRDFDQNPHEIWRRSAIGHRGTNELSGRISQLSQRCAVIGPEQS
jgi:hypothetical protein